LIGNGPQGQGVRRCEAAGGFDGIEKELAGRGRKSWGFYLDPPEHAIVLSVDEKSQIQALDIGRNPSSRKPVEGIVAEAPRSRGSPKKEEFRPGLGRINWPLKDGGIRRVVNTRT